MALLCRLLSRGGGNVYNKSKDKNRFDGKVVCLMGCMNENEGTLSHIIH